MRHASLFTGIGGFDLAAQWMGWTNVFQVEIDSFCQKVLQKNFPNAQRHGDIKQFDGSRYKGTIDVLSGGFPCQPYSSAGKRLGKEDERHLWPEMLRVIREVSPCWVVGENVRGLTNWNGGLVFDEVQADLEVAGYEVLPFLLPAAGVGAPHRRERIWFIAYSGRGPSDRRQDKQTNDVNNGPNAGRSEETNIITRLSTQGAITDTPRQRERKQTNEVNTIPKKRETWVEFGGISRRGNVTHTNDKGLEGLRNDTAISGQNAGNVTRSDWNLWPTQSPVCGRNDGLSNRVDRIKSLGNAVVPQVVYQIFKAIEQYEQVIESLK